MRKNWKNSHIPVAIGLLALIILSFAVRFYNFHDWLYFKMDQARDASLISNAVINGPGYLPLLGPRAGATDVSVGHLNLGPAFYYFQYISGKIFNSTSPDVFAYPDLFFSILTIPLLYFFLRLYFSRKNSFLIVMMYAFSFIVIQYSRFAWNPNSLLFFTLLSFYGLLKFINSENNKQRIRWVIVWALGLSIGSQLHFLGLFCLLGISAIILLAHFKPWKKSEIFKLKDKNVMKKALLYFMVFIFTVGLIYTPVIISDTMKKGENAKNFIQAFSTKPNKKPIMTKITRSLDKQTKYYCLITTSGCFQGKININLKLGIPTALLVLAGISLLIFRIAKSRKEDDGPVSKYRKDFLWLILAWFGVLFLLAIPLYSSLRPRFFIFVFPIPFIFLGLIFEFLEEKFSGKAKYFSFLATAIILLLNARGVKAWFSEQSRSQESSLTIQRTLILKNQDGVALGQLEKAVDYMYEKKEKNSDLYFYVKQEHIAPMKYLLSQKNDPNLKYFSIKKVAPSSNPYFIIIPSKNNTEYLKKEFGSAIEIMDSYKAGQIRVYKVIFTGNPEEEKIKPEADLEEKTSERIFWKDVFNR